MEAQDAVNRRRRMALLLMLMSLLTMFIILGPDDTPQESPAEVIERQSSLSVTPQASSRVKKLSSKRHFPSNITQYYTGHWTLLSKEENAMSFVARYNLSLTAFLQEAPRPTHLYFRSTHGAMVLKLSSSMELAPSVHHVKGQIYIADGSYQTDKDLQTNINGVYLSNVGALELYGSNFPTALMLTETVKKGRALPAARDPTSPKAVHVENKPSSSSAPPANASHAAPTSGPDDAIRSRCSLSLFASLQPPGQAPPKVPRRLQGVGGSGSVEETPRNARVSSNAQPLHRHHEAADREFHMPPASSGAPWLSALVHSARAVTTGAPVDIPAAPQAMTHLHKSLLLLDSLSHYPIANGSALVLPQPASRRLQEDGGSLRGSSKEEHPGSTSSPSNTRTYGYGSKGPPAITAKGVITSDNCPEVGMNITLTAFLYDRDLVLEKAMTYAFLAIVVVIAQTGAVIRELLKASTHAHAFRMSLATVALQAIMDSYLALAHMFSGVALPVLFNNFATVAFLKLMLFSVLEMRLLLSVWRSHRLDAFQNGWDAIRRQIGILYSRFYLTLLVGLGAIYYIAMYDQTWLPWFLVMLFSFWTPQIIHSAVHNVSPGPSISYIIVMTVTRLFIPLYFLVCPVNFLQVMNPYKPSYTTSIIMSTWLVVQAATLLLQRRRPRWFIPPKCMPAPYNYSQRLALRRVECRDGSLVQRIVGVENIHRRAAEAEEAAHAEPEADTRLGRLLQRGKARWRRARRFVQRVVFPRRAQDNSGSHRRTRRGYEEVPTDSGNLEGGAVAAEVVVPVAAEGKEEGAGGGAEEGGKEAEGVEEAGVQAMTPGEGTVVENGENVTCPICFRPVLVPSLGLGAGSGSEAEDAEELSRYLITPCDHLFHAQCLSQWLDVKMECPVCRHQLPPVEQLP